MGTEASTRTPTQAEINAAVERDNAESSRHVAAARKLDAEAEQAEISLRKLRRLERAELAKDYHHKIYVFDKAVGASSVEACIQRLAEWSRTDPKCDIEIIFNSPGGSVVDGFALWDYITRIKAAGHNVTTSSMGMAASMAGILLQAGNTRKMGSQAWLLIHEASFGAGGSFGDVVDTVEWVRMVQDRILDIFASRAKESAATKPMSKAQIKRRWHRKDWWISADDALTYGFVDEIG